MDNLPDGSYEISPYGWDRRRLLGDHGTAALGQHHQRYRRVLVRPGRETVLHGRQAQDGARLPSRAWSSGGSTNKVHWCATYPAIDESSLAVDSFFSDIDSLFQVDWDDHGSRLVVHVERQPDGRALLPPARQDRQLHPQVGLPREPLPANRGLGERKRRLGCQVTRRGESRRASIGPRRVCAASWWCCWSSGELGGQVGTTGLLVLVCVAVLAIALLNRRNRSNR